MSWLIRLSNGRFVINLGTSTRTILCDEPREHLARDEAFVWKAEEAAAAAGTKFCKHHNDTLGLPGITFTLEKVDES